MWNAPSDRDCFDSHGWDEYDQDDEPRYCGHCGARWDQACEDWCYTNASASEPASTEDAEREPPTGTTVFQIQSRQFSDRYRPYPSVRHCFEFMYEIDALRQLDAIQNKLPVDMFRVVPVVKHTSYAQVECYCEDCGLMTGHYSSLVYERRITLCSDCSLRRYLSRDWTDEENAAANDALGPASLATASAMS
jgi:hypothetical protein